MCIHFKAGITCDPVEAEQIRAKYFLAKQFDENFAEEVPVVHMPTTRDLRWMQLAQAHEREQKRIAQRHRQRRNEGKK